MGNRYKHVGFTLMELMVAMAITAILVMQAVPAFSGMLRSLRLSAAASAYFSSASLARSEAIKRNSRVVLCKSALGTACNATGGWDQGWIVFHDANGNAMWDEGEDLVARQGALQSSIRFTGNDPVANYVSYTATGKSKLVSGAFQAGTLTVCAETKAPAEARQIIINGTGRLRTVKAVVAHCP